MSWTGPSPNRSSSRRKSIPMVIQSHSFHCRRDQFGRTAKPKLFMRLTQQPTQLNLRSSLELHALVATSMCEQIQHISGAPIPKNKRAHSRAAINRQTAQQQQTIRGPALPLSCHLEHGSPSREWLSSMHFRFNLHSSAKAPEKQAADSSSARSPRCLDHDGHRELSHAHPKEMCLPAE